MPILKNKVKEYEDGLYTHKLVMPGLLFWIVAFVAANIYTLTMLQAFATGAPTWEIIYGVLAVFVLAPASFLAIICEGADCIDKPKRLLARVYFGKRDLPKGYQSEFLNEPEYQNILNEYMNGSNISHLGEVNELLYRKRELEGYDHKGNYNSKVVENTSESLKAYVKAMEDAKATYDELQASYPIGGSSNS